jgi:hypothetical protein
MILHVMMHLPKFLVTRLACFTSNPRFFTGVGGRGGSP